MNAAWLQELLPQAILAPRTKFLWVLFFALFPLAYVGGVMLQLTEESTARIPGATNRAISISRAQEFAASKGLPVASWQQYATAETNETLLAYYGDAKQPALAALSTLAPARDVQVLFRSPDHNHECRVFLSLTGQVIGYDFGKSTAEKRSTVDFGAFQVNSNPSDSGNGRASNDGTPKALNDQDVESIARRVLSANAALSSLVKLGPAKVTGNVDDPARNDVEWDVKPAIKKELNLHVTVSVRDSKIVAERIEPSIDMSAFMSGVTKKPKFPIILNTIYGIFLTFGAFYAMYRYAKRTLQKEVSHFRTLVVAALFCASYSVFVYSLGLDQLAIHVSEANFIKVAIISAASAFVVLALMGLPGGDWVWQW